MSWWQVLEQAFVQLTQDPEMRERYGDPARGATLAQAWRAAQLYGVPAQVCLLDSDQPRVTGAGVTTLVLVQRDQLVELVCRALLHRARSGATLFVFDGSTGHSVTALAADADRSGVTFHDPWPGDSLLSVGRNQAGVAAQRLEGEWHVTTAELQKVLVAAFILPGVWAALLGQPGPTSLSQLRSSDLWKFFNLRETGRDASDPTYVTIRLQPGGFVEHVGMELICYETEEISSAKLRLRESWVIGPPMGINPYAKDLAKSWLATLVPEADREAIAPLVDEVWGLHLDGAFKAKTEDPNWRESDKGRMVVAYLGLEKEPFYTAFSQSSLTVESEPDEEGAPWTTIRLELW